MIDIIKYCKKINGINVRELSNRLMFIKASVLKISDKEIRLISVPKTLHAIFNDNGVYRKLFMEKVTFPKRNKFMSFLERKKIIKVKAIAENIVIK